METKRQRELHQRAAATAVERCQRENKPELFDTYMEEELERPIGRGERFVRTSARQITCWVDHAKAAKVAEKRCRQECRPDLYARFFTEALSASA